ncbi:MAG: integrase arm-type DNA-binding domain-containing protein [Pseudomonadota bacterium]
MSKLTKLEVKNKSKDGMHSDGQGLYLRVRGKAKSWILRVTVRGQKSRREIGLGGYPDVSLAEAREKAAALRAEAKAGNDPKAKRDHKETTFEEAARELHQSLEMNFRTEKNSKQWVAILERYAFPHIGSNSVADVNRAEVLDVLLPIWTEKFVTAKKLRSRISQVLDFAAAKGYRTQPNAVDNVLRSALPRRPKPPDHHPALALDEIALWWRDLAQRNGTAAQALRFLTLTCARSGEVRNMTWDELELGNVPTWTIPADRMKNGRTHRVPLSDEAVGIVEDQNMHTRSSLVFTAPRGGTLSDMSISAVMRRLHKGRHDIDGASYLDPVSKRPAVPHGLRSTFRQWAAEMGYPYDLAELALAHFVGSEVARAYQRSDMVARRRKMMEAWTQFVTGKRGEVVELRA